MAPFDHFDFLAPWYDRVIGVKDTSRLAELAGLPNSGPVLDAGGGTGRIAQTLTGLASPIILADPSMKMLDQASQKGSLLLLKTVSERLPFKDNTFSAVIMVDALHHVYDQAASAAEMLRVVRPGGRLVIEEPDINSWIIKAVALAEKLALMRSRFLSPEQIVRLFPPDTTKTFIEKEGYNAWIVVQKLA
jgi:ubiquinone/menaquinone biosynthesis C-methylase UbiE